MWYSQGSITATNDNTVITGVGAGFAYTRIRG